jgi:hypothetical protein
MTESYLFFSDKSSAKISNVNGPYSLSGNGALANR